jgi:hypothetical protein
MRGYWARRACLAAGAAAALVGCSGSHRPARPATVPNVVGMSLQDAAATLGRQHLYIQRVRARADDSELKAVVRQDPPPGTPVGSRRDVSVILSAGPSPRGPAVSFSKCELVYPVDCSGFSGGGIGLARIIGAGGPFFVADCGGRLVSRPTQIILACGDAGAVLDHLHWTHHERSEATAVGIFRTKSGCCGPTSKGRVAVRAFFPFAIDTDGDLAYGCMTVRPTGNGAESFAGPLLTTWGLHRLQHLPTKFPAARCDP